MKQWKRVCALLMLVVLFSQSTFAAAQHWANPFEEALRAQGVIDELPGAYGTQVTYEAFEKMFLSVGLRAKGPTTFTPKHTGNKQVITRVGALELMLEHLGLAALVAYNQNAKLVYNDVEAQKGVVYLAYRFGWISKSPTLMFRPNDSLKVEEALALLYNVSNKNSAGFDRLHSYYAIKSFDQAGLAADLTDLSYGWSRLELGESGDVVVNMSSQNQNEYHVPMGYQEAIKQTDHTALDQYLMVFVKDQVVAEGDTKQSLTEYLISTPTLRNQTVEAIVESVRKYRYQMDFEGVLIDFETLRGEENAKRFNQFLIRLKEALDTYDLKLITAVHPARKNNQAYYDGYDFKTIGDVSEYVVLMAHDYYPKRLTEDEMLSAITLTPLTPINEIFDALDILTDPKTGVTDPKKVLLQLSMDAIQWKIVEGAIVNATPYRPRYSTILSRIENGAVLNYSEKLQSAQLVFEDKIDNSRNIIWYESEKSVTAKLRLAQNMGIGGISVWRLGLVPDVVSEKEKIQLWDVILSFKEPAAPIDQTIKRE